MYLPQNGKVTLTAHCPHLLPNANLLETHAAVAQILHVTGMGEYIDNILRERQLIRCFAPDCGIIYDSLLKSGTSTGVSRG